LKKENQLWNPKSCDECCHNVLSLKLGCQEKKNQCSNAVGNDVTLKVEAFGGKVGGVYSPNLSLIQFILHMKDQIRIEMLKPT
jgi:hypothetical protein